MNGFSSYAPLIQEVVTKAVTSAKLHAKWLNTLSYLENWGAKAIAACEHPTLVKEEMLKHASEEFRHAHHLKKQLAKLNIPLETYALESILGNKASLHYLKALNIQTSRYLQSADFLDLKEPSYILMSYAIELRADELYPIYHKILKKTHSRVTVSSILYEEKAHLHEMLHSLQKIPKGVFHAENISKIESSLSKKWLQGILHELKT